jgi:hypothetical protein
VAERVLVEKLPDELLQHTCTQQQETRIGYMHECKNLGALLRVTRCQRLTCTMRAAKKHTKAHGGMFHT